MRKIISFTYISLDGFVTGPNGEMNWIKVDVEIFDHVGKQITEGDTYPLRVAHCPPLAELVPTCREEVLQYTV